MNQSIDFRSIRAILFDWAGTTIDYGSLAPVEVFRDVFARYGVDVSEAEAREPMGQAKLDHIRAVFAMPRIAGVWTKKFGGSPTESDIQSMYTKFLLLQKQILAVHSSLISGVPEAIQWFRDHGIKIGSTTGYTRELMDVVIPLAAAQGYSPDVTLCSDEVTAGRPAPWLNFRAAELLGVFPMQNVMIVDDSVAGIQAGRNAGCIAVAVSKTGNAMGLSESAVHGLAIEDLKARLLKIESDFLQAGAHMVVESVSDLVRFFE